MSSMVDSAPSDGNVVFLSETHGSRHECAEKLRNFVSTEANSHILIFSATDSFDDLDSEWDKHVGEDIMPENVAIILASQSGADAGEYVAESGTPVSVNHMKPNDLTGISIAFTKVLRSWEGKPVTICLRDLDTLTMYHDMDVVFRFIRSILDMCNESTIDLHAHLRRDTLSEKNLSTLLTLFDSIERQ